MPEADDIALAGSVVRLSYVKSITHT